ncbi:30S ribosomal protein S6e [Candidatus Woesearchaeota archaeon]|nr:30S ribosomal protein S6e [Candidatus Woesearchaeota archaeon]
MAEFKLVLGTKDGKSFQKEVKSPEADVLLRKVVGEKVEGKGLGLEGYEFEITGGSDKAGFPMRKGIKERRKRIMVSGGVGFSGKDRNKNKKKGLKRKKTVCGERIDSNIVQINLRVLKEGKAGLGEAPVEEKPAEE